MEAKPDIDELNSKFKKTVLNFNSHCNYSNIENINFKNKFSVASFNIRSLDKNGHKLTNLLNLSNNMPDIIALSEVWSNLNNYTLQGFHPLIVETRKDKRGGGVGLLFKN